MAVSCAGFIAASEFSQAQGPLPDPCRRNSRIAVPGWMHQEWGRWSGLVRPPFAHNVNDDAGPGGFPGVGKAGTGVQSRRRLIRSLRSHQCSWPVTGGVPVPGRRSRNRTSPDRPRSPRVGSGRLRRELAFQCARLDSNHSRSCIAPLRLDPLHFHVVVLDCVFSGGDDGSNTFNEATHPLPDPASRN